MAYDEHLEQRIRALIPDEPGITSKKMFGGLAFMLDGNMAVGVSNDELMVRVDPDDFDDLAAETDVRPFEMGGRGMKGWLLAGGQAIAEDADLERWIDIGMSYAGSLPPK